MRNANKQIKDTLYHPMTNPMNIYIYTLFLKYFAIYTERHLVTRLKDHFRHMKLQEANIPVCWALSGKAVIFFIYHLITESQTRKTWPYPPDKN